MGTRVLVEGDERIAGSTERQCGRCRRAFPGDSDLFFQTDWALCPECEAVLLPKRLDTPPSKN